MKAHALFAATFLTIALTAALFVTAQNSRGAGRSPGSGPPV